MKVFNLTDVPTPLLERRGLAKTAFKVGSTVVVPGSSVEVKDTGANRQELASFIAAGAASIGRPPKGYEPAPKEKLQKKESPKPNPLPVPEPSSLIASKPEESSEGSSGGFTEEKYEEGGRRKGRRKDR